MPGHLSKASRGGKLTAHITTRMARWDEIENAYHRARDLHVEDRSRFLDERCGSDESMRRQVEILLAQDANPTSFLNHPAVEQVAGWRAFRAGGATLTGRTVGPYEVVEHIGSGGMGEVYRARDTKLNRDVALKILPDVFALDPGRLARFRREAQLLASLNHPHIAGIYGLEESNDVHALVLEFVDGPTLADRLALGAVPVDEALPIARQIAEALESAHEHGIVHRDLKPANIKLRHDGTVKVLDFGLAKALEPGADVEGRAAFVTSPPVTEAGAILGTPAYMSPEQAKGHRADKRSDVWAFGCVLYEMLAGRRPFRGDDVGDSMAAVLRDEPDWNALPATVHPPIRALIEGCLEKDRKQRVADLSTARFVLNERRVSTATVGDTRAASKPIARQTLAIGGCLLGAIAGIAGWYLRPSVAPPLSRFAIAMAAPFSTNSPFSDLDVSPDGANLVYLTGTSPATTALWLRPIDQLDAVRLQGLQMPWSPFFSADGQWIGFFSVGELKKLSIKDRTPVSICHVQGRPQGASWNQRNDIAFATNDAATGLLIVSADGGEPTVLTKPAPEAGEVDHLFPSFLPSGDAVLFTVTTNKGIDESQVAVLDLRTGERKTLIRGGSNARYAETGHIVYVSAGGLRAVRFDPTGLNVTGESVALVERVLTKSSGAADFSVSGQGTLVYVAGEAAGPRRSLVWVDRQGHEERINAEPRAYVYPRLSPDGTRIALDARDQDSDIWVWDLAHETLSSVTRHPAADVAPIWTPDGRDIIFGSTRNGAQNLYRQPADGSRPAERLTASDSTQFPLSISPGGSQVVVRQETSDAVLGFDLVLLHLASPVPSGDAVARTTLVPMRTPYPKDNGVISPDGRWLAYESNESNQYQIYVGPFPDLGGGRWQVSTGGGRAPLWAPNGRELFYLDANGFLTRVPVDTSGAFGYGKPARLLYTSYYTLNIRTYDVSRDGQKFLMIKSPGAGDQQTVASQSIIVVQNWFEDLKRRASVK
jgi:serine/threonine protein kinase